MGESILLSTSDSQNHLLLSASEKSIYKNLNYFPSSNTVQAEAGSCWDCAGIPILWLYCARRNIYSILGPSTLELAWDTGTKILELVFTSSISFTNWSRAPTIPSNFTDAQKDCLVYLYRYENTNLEITKHYSLVVTFTKSRKQFLYQSGFQCIFVISFIYYGKDLSLRPDPGHKEVVMLIQNNSDLQL